MAISIGLSLWLFLAEAANAQASTSTQQSSSPLASITLILLIVCAVRRKKEIGGWLLFFFAQVFIGGAMAVFVSMLSIRYLKRSTWSDTSRYLLNLASTVPSTLMLLLLV